MGQRLFWTKNRRAHTLFQQKYHRGRDFSVLRKIWGWDDFDWLDNESKTFFTLILLKFAKTDIRLRILFRAIPDSLSTQVNYTIFRLCQVLRNEFRHVYNFDRHVQFIYPKSWSVPTMAYYIVNIVGHVPTKQIVIIHLRSCVIWGIIMFLVYRAG